MKKNKFKQKLRDIFVASILPLVLILFFLGFAFIIEKIRLSSEDLSELQQFGISIGKYICELGLSVMVGSYLISFWGNVSYAKKVLSELLCDDTYLDMISMSKKKKLKSDLIKSIYTSKKIANCEDDDNSITTILDEDMDLILKDYYYDKYNLIVSIKRNETYIEKTFSVDFNAKSLKDRQRLVSFVNSTFSPLENVNNPVEFTSLTINNKSIHKDELKTILKGKPITSPIYSMNYTMNEYIENHNDLFSFDKEINVKYTYTTKVSLDDHLFTFRIPKACKNLRFTYASDDYAINTSEFGLGAIAGSGKINHMDNGQISTLEYTDWILPGEGVALFLKEKEPVAKEVKTAGKEEKPVVKEEKPAGKN